VPTVNDVNANAGRIECTYEPAMTKAFLHGRTEAIRSVQPESVEFTRVCLSLCFLFFVVPMFIN